MESRGNRSLWRLEGESYPNEKKLHEFCFVPDDSEDRLFYVHLSPFRVLIKYSPLISFITYLFFLIIYPAFTPLNGIFDLVSVDLVLMITALVYLFIFFLTFSRLFADKDNLFSIKRLCTPVLFYSGLLFLVIGTAGSIALVTFPQGETLEPNAIFVSGYFLLLYVGGPIVYDGMLRTERLFNNLNELDIVEINEPLSHHPSGGIDTEPFHRHITILLMTFWFWLPFAYVWYFDNGPFNTNSKLILSVNIFFNIILTLLAIYFLLINRDLYLLLSGSEKGSIRFTYELSHPDLTAGYRDLGRFASRVNLLLLLSLLYLIYRLYVQGRLYFLLEGENFSLGSITPTWIASYLIPVFIFLSVVFVWFYSSFWLMHRAMERGREEWLWDTHRDEHENVINYEKSLSARDAPVWPVNQRFVVAVLSADVISLFIAISTLLV